MMRRFLFLLLCLTSAVLSATDQAHLGCKNLRVVLDNRLTPMLVTSLWGSGESRSEAPAKLELLGCNGQLLHSIALAAPLAQLDPQPILGAPYATYLVSADLTAEMGSYSGPLTIPMQVVDDHLVAAVAYRDDHGVEPIRLAITGKASWLRLVAGKSEQLLSVRSQPKDDRFETEYMRYFLIDGQWHVKIRIRDELWESDGEFPGPESFP